MLLVSFTIDISVVLYLGMHFKYFVKLLRNIFVALYLGTHITPHFSIWNSVLYCWEIFLWRGTLVCILPTRCYNKVKAASLYCRSRAYSTFHSKYRILWENSQNATLFDILNWSFTRFYVLFMMFIVMSCLWKKRSRFCITNYKLILNKTNSISLIIFDTIRWYLILSDFLVWFTFTW